MVDAGSTDSMLAILEKLKRDHAETEQLLALREHERRVRASNLSERHDAIAKAEAEIDDIVRKTQQSAGNAQQLDESIKSDLGSPAIEPRPHTAHAPRLLSSQVRSGRSTRRSRGSTVSSGE